MCISNKYVLLMGDFNARTFNKPDFLEEDEFFNNHFNYDDNMTEFFNVSSLLSNCKLSELRTSQDQMVNNEVCFLIYANQIIYLFLMVVVAQTKILVQ